MTQQLIKQIKTKIQETQTLIAKYNQEIATKENTLLILIQELTRIELNLKENMKINQTSPKGLSKTK